MLLTVLLIAVPLLVLLGCALKTLRFGYSLGGDVSIGASTVSVTGDLLHALSPTVSGTWTNQAIPEAFAYAKLKGVHISCDKACTIKTNSSSSPDNSFSISAGGVLEWAYGGAGVNPFTANVTSIFVSTASGAVLNMVFLIDL